MKILVKAMILSRCRDYAFLLIQNLCFIGVYGLLYCI